MSWTYLKDYPIWEENILEIKEGEERLSSVKKPQQDPRNLQITQINNRINYLKSKFDLIVSNTKNVSLPTFIIEGDLNNQPVNLTIKLTNFIFLSSPPEPHVYTNWIIEDLDNGGVIFQSLNDTVNKLQITIPNNVLKINTNYRIKASFNTSNTIGDYNQIDIKTANVIIEDPLVIVNITDGINPNITINSSNFNTLQGTDIHISTDWIIKYTNTNTIIYQSLQDTINLTSLYYSSNDIIDGVYEIKVRYNGENVSSDWVTVNKTLISNPLNKPTVTIFYTNNNLKYEDIIKITDNLNIGKTPNILNSNLKIKHNGNIVINEVLTNKKLLYKIPFLSLKPRKNYTVEALINYENNLSTPSRIINYKPVRNYTLAGNKIIDPILNKVLFNHFCVLEKDEYFYVVNGAYQYSLKVNNSIYKIRKDNLSFERFNISLPIGNRNFSILYGNYIYIFGGSKLLPNGYIDGTKISNRVFRVNINTQQVEEMNPMPYKGTEVRCILKRNSTIVYILLPRTNYLYATTSNKFLKYDISTDTYTILPQPTEDMLGTSFIETDNNEIFAISSNVNRNTIFKLDETNYTFNTIINTPYKLKGFFSTHVYDNVFISLINNNMEVCDTYNNLIELYNTTILNGSNSNTCFYAYDKNNLTLYGVGRVNNQYGTIFKHYL